MARDDERRGQGPPAPGSGAQGTSGEVGVDSWSDTQVDGPAQGGAPDSVSIPGYRILGKIHQGGQGVVFRAHQFSTNRTVAIKVLREGAYASDTARRRFQREVEIVAGLDHPGIVQIFDSGRTREGHPYFVMEYVRGRPLDEHVREHDTPLQEIVATMAEVLTSVQYAHERGVVHRDLKPANILVDEDGRPRILDFGLARGDVNPVESVISTDGQFVGTVAYMSPEQVAGKVGEVDGRTDVYALGVLLYQLLTGRFPYDVTGQLMDVLRSITEVEPRPPARSWSSETGVRRRYRQERLRGRCPIDGDLETIVLKAMAKDRERRYPSAGAFAGDLVRYLDGRPITAKRDSGLYVLRKRIARQRGVLTAAVVAAVVAGGVMWWALAGREPSRPPLDPVVKAQYEAAADEYAGVVAQLEETLAERTAGDPEAGSVGRESLDIIRAAIVQLQEAVRNDPENQELRQLLLNTYQREIDLLRRLTSLPDMGGSG